MSIRALFVRPILLLALTSVLSEPAQAGWTREYLDPPDNHFESHLGDGWFTDVTEVADQARAIASAVAGPIFSTSAEAVACETTVRRHTWTPEPGFPTARFSWMGQAKVLGRFRIYDPPASTSGMANATSKCDGFGMASINGSGGLTSVSGPGASVTVPGAGSMTLPTHGMGGGSGFFAENSSDGDTKCVTVAIVRKEKYACVVTWADSRWIPPKIGEAKGDVQGNTGAEENELDGCSE